MRSGFDGCGDMVPLKNVHASMQPARYPVPAPLVERSWYSVAVPVPASVTRPGTRAANLLRTRTSPIRAGRSMTVPAVNWRPMWPRRPSCSTAVRGFTATDDHSTGFRRPGMAHCYYHALSSVRKWGGTVDDYLPLHQWFDQVEGYSRRPYWPLLRAPCRGGLCSTLLGETLACCRAAGSFRSSGRRTARTRRPPGSIPSFADWARLIAGLDVEAQLL